MKRLQISLNKGKSRRIDKLDTRNQELKEILKYCERTKPIVDKRKSSGPSVLFEKMFQHACAVHNALVRNWRCSSRTCRTHQANLCLQAEVESISFNVLFVFEHENESLPEVRKQEVRIEAVKEDSRLVAPTDNMGYVQRTESFTAVQESFIEMKTNEKKVSFGRFFQRAANSDQRGSSPRNGKDPSKNGKQVHFATPIPAITISQDRAGSPEATTSAGSNISCQRIADLCSSLQSSPTSDLGIIIDDFDRQFHLLKSMNSSPATLAPDEARLIPLSKILNAYHQASIDIPRHRRFKMAAHIASALLQIHTSPWLSNKWSKDHFFFLADAQNVYSDYPYVSQDFTPNALDTPAADVTYGNQPSNLEEDTRKSLFTVGVIILELIFGHNIEACSFRHRYYGPNNEPTDHTDVSTAQKWAQKVLGECGAEIDDVVRRCLNCSFGPRPNLKDKRFKEAVYDGVIRPLVDHLKLWQVTMP